MVVADGTTKIASLTLVAVAVGGGLATVLGTTDGAEAGAIGEETRAAMGIFREPRTALDNLPGNPQQELDRAKVAQPGENVGLARRIAYPEGDAFLWPMTDGVCHTSPAGSGCVPIRVIARRGVDMGVQTRLDLSTRTYGDVRVFGIARDGIERVRLTLHDGSEVSAAVHDNTFLAVGLRDRPASVNWVDSLGAHRLTVPGQAANALAEEILGR